MKKMAAIFLIFALMLTGCSGGASGEKASDDNPAVSENADESSSLNNTDTVNESSVRDNEDTVNEDDGGSSGIDVDITEKMYVAYINEIYVNTDDYIGKTIRIQGMFQAYTDEDTGNTYYYVYRTGPGCCGNDGAMCGFEFTWGGDMPKDNDWIEVIGALRTYEEDGWTYLTLDAKSITVMKERGAETVYQ